MLQIIASIEQLQIVRRPITFWYESFHQVWCHILPLVECLWCNVKDHGSDARGTNSRQTGSQGSCWHSRLREIVPEWKLELLLCQISILRWSNRARESVSTWLDGPQDGNCLARQEWKGISPSRVVLGWYKQHGWLCNAANCLIRVTEAVTKPGEHPNPEPAELSKAVRPIGNSLSHQSYALLCQGRNWTRQDLDKGLQWWRKMSNPSTGAGGSVWILPASAGEGAQRM